MPEPTTSPAAAPRARGTKGEETASRILDAAEALFAEQGFAGTTLRDVAASVGLRIPSLYNHFESKEQLYGAVLDRSVRPVVELLTRIVEAPAAERPEPADIIQAVMDLLEVHEHLPQLLHHETLSGGQRFNPILRERIAPIFSRAHESVEAHDNSGLWSQEQVPLLVLALYNVLVGYHTIAPFYREVMGVDLATPEARARQTRFFTQLTEALLDGPPSRT